MSDNIYKELMDKMSPDQRAAALAKVLGPYTTIPLSTEVAAKLWSNELQYLYPIETYQSLHVFEQVYTWNGGRYCCYWALGDDGDSAPYLIEHKVLRT